VAIEHTRYVPLAFEQTSGGLTVSSPVDGNSGNSAPPGVLHVVLGERFRRSFRRLYSAGSIKEEETHRAYW
jgi:hypothetical protein